jgi:hypothetical protein
MNDYIVLRTIKLFIEKVGDHFRWGGLEIVH